MSGESAALLYLLQRTTRNRLGRQLQRLRQPKYLLGSVLTIGYFWLVYFRRAIPTGHGDMAGNWGDIVPVLGAIGLLLSVAGIWFSTGGGGVLAFAPAEVQFLFTAPLSRRALLAYRLGRAQIVVLLNALVWSLLAHRLGATLPAVQRFAIAWGLISLLSLHRFGAALVRVRPLDATRRVITLGARVALALAVLAVGAAARPVLMSVNDLGFRAGLRPLGAALSTGLAGLALAPFRLVVAPALATGPAAFMAAFGIVAGIVALHVVWVLSMNVVFEEAAATASVNQAAKTARLRAFRSGGMIAPKQTSASRSWLPLAPVGHPGWAIVWKNTLAFIRTRMYIPLLIFGALGIFLGGMVGGADSERGGPAWGSLGITGIFVLMLVVMGPRFLRNDLRVDMLALASLKGYPLTGRQMVVAQLGSPALILTVTQTIILLIGVVRLPHGVLGTVPPLVGGAAAVLVPLFLLGLNLLALAVQNGIALVFPGWTRFGADSGGFESMGQNLLLSVGSLAALALLVILPLGLGGGLVALGGYAFDIAPVIGAVAGVVVAILVMAAELLSLSAVLGRSFEKCDPGALG